MTDTTITVTGDNITWDTSVEKLHDDLRFIAGYSSANAALIVIAYAAKNLLNRLDSNGNTSLEGAEALRAAIRMAEDAVYPKIEIEND